MIRRTGIPKFDYFASNWPKRMGAAGETPTVATTGSPAASTVGAPPLDACYAYAARLVAALYAALSLRTAPAYARIA